MDDVLNPKISNNAIAFFPNLSELPLCAPCGNEEELERKSRYHFERAMLNLQKQKLIDEEYPSSKINNKLMQIQWDLRHIGKLTLR